VKKNSAEPESVARDVARDVTVLAVPENQKKHAVKNRKRSKKN